MKDPFSGIESNFPPTTKKTLLKLYAASAFFTVAGLVCIYNQASDIPIDTSRLLAAVAITLFGIAFGLCVYFRRMIPLRAKIYSACLVFTVGGIWMAIEPRGDYRHSAESVRFVGAVGALLSGAAGLFVLYKDLRFHFERRNEIDEVGEVETITDGVIRFNTNDETEIMETFDRFDFQNSQEELLKPRIVRREFHSLLFLHDIDYSDFYFLFNWLVYRKTTARDYSLRGWLKESHLEVKGNSVTGPIMLFIPSDDKEYDNVCFVSSHGKCYKQEFANSQRLHEVNGHAVPFEPYPEM